MWACAASCAQMAKMRVKSAFRAFCALWRARRESNAVFWTHKLLRETQENAKLPKLSLDLVVRCTEG